MSRFLGRLELEEADGTDDGQWLLERPLTYESDVARCTFTVPACFRTDLASVPRLPLVYLLCGGTASKAAVVHDYLYASGLVSRRVADAVLREASAITGVPLWRRWLMWAGVRAFGWLYWRH